MEKSLKLTLLKHHQLRERKSERAWKSHWGLAGDVGGKDWPCQQRNGGVRHGSGYLCHLLLRDQTWSKNLKKTIAFEVCGSTRNPFCEGIREEPRGWSGSEWYLQITAKNCGREGGWKGRSVTGLGGGRNVFFYWNTKIFKPAGGKKEPGEKGKMTEVVHCGGRKMRYRGQVESLKDMDLESGRQIQICLLGPVI